MTINKYGISIQHFANLGEDKSYPAKERNKFLGWYNKWTEERFPGLFKFESFAACKVII